MSERYWLTGVQLTMLGNADILFSERQRIFNEVYDKQFVGNNKELIRILTMNFPFHVRLEKALQQANTWGLHGVNLEYNPKKMKELIDEVLK